MKKPPVAGAIFLLSHSMVSQSDLFDFARSLPEGLHFTPIFGGKRPDHSYEPHPGKTHKGIADLDLAIRQGHADYTGIGLWCNRITRLAILDVDCNLAMTLEQFGDDLALAPCIRSPRKNAGKYLFRVDKDEDFDTLHGVSLAASGKGFEILWGPARQGVVFGDYGPNDHAPDGGVYTLEGDIQNIPPAPGWMLAMMRQARESDIATTGVLELKYGGQRRPLEHTRNIIRGCLSVLSPDLGYDAWLAIGMSIHSAMPGEEGLDFWRNWSKQSVVYAEQWESGEDVCARKWATFKRGKTTIGTIMWWGDKYDRMRTRFDEDTRARLAEDELKEKDSFEDLMQKLEVIYNHIDDPAMADHELEVLRANYPRCDRGFLDSLYVSHMQYKSSPPMQTGSEFMDEVFEADYIVPDVFYAPSVVLLYAEPGAGKTQAALAIGKTVMRSTDISIRGRKMPVAGGTLLIAQNDQNNMVLQEMLVQHGYKVGDDFYVRNGFSIRDRAGAIRMLNEVKPRFVIIDSLSACSIGSPYSENAKEFADPLYFLAKGNGTLFPACCILVIHHSNKQGGHRGTIAITAAVDETMKMRLPDDEEIRVNGPDMRVLNFEKSRCGRGGTHLNMVMNTDLSFTLSDPERPAETPRTSRVETIQVKVLDALREAFPHDQTVWELCNTTHTADTSVRPNLARMVKRGLIAKGPEREELARDGKVRKVSSYVAVLSSHISTTDVAPLPLEPAGEPEAD
jgi:hypothetical protein